MSAEARKAAKAAQITQVITEAAPIIARVLAETGGLHVNFAFSRTAVYVRTTRADRAHVLEELMTAFTKAGWGFSASLLGEVQLGTVSLLPPWTLTQTAELSAMPVTPKPLSSSPRATRPTAAAGECDVLHRHVEGAQGHQRCEEHGRCIGCDGCPPCERWAEWGKQIETLATSFPDKVRKAQRAANDVRVLVKELVQLYDIELVEGPDANDVLAELDTVDRALRNIKRIADARRALAEREA